MNTPLSDIAAATAARPLDLTLDVEALKGELAPWDPSAIGADSKVDAELDQKAQHFADALVNQDPKDYQGQEDKKAAVEEMGRSLQREAAHRSKMLQQPIRDLSQRGEDGGSVANALIDLKTEVEALDPSLFDFSSGWFTRLLGKIPGVGSPLKRYFSKFESTQTLIDAIIHSLEEGRAQLRRDNVTLREDQVVMRQLTLKLQRQVLLAQLLDQKLQLKLEREIQEDESRRRFVQEELLFPLRQRTIDLQQQLAVNQQGILSTAIVMRNNNELIRGVDRAIHVTVSALQVAVMVAIALANQKIVLDKVSALNKTTSDLITGTASRLKSQGTAIHTQASQAMLDMDALKSAFADIHAAMDEMARYRQEALPQMAQVILDFNQLTVKGEEAVQRLEAGDRTRPTLEIEAG